MSTHQSPDLKEPYILELLKVGHKPPDDKSWLETFANMCQSQSTFILAELKADEQLVERAGDLIVYRHPHFPSVRQLMEACASHNWNKTLYEAWVWELRNGFIP